MEHKTSLGLSDDREMLLAGIDTDMLIGDKSPVGLGSVDLKSDLGGAALNAYTQYLGDCADAIRSTLDGLVAGKMQ